MKQESGIINFQEEYNSFNDASLTNASLSRDDIHVS